MRKKVISFALIVITIIALQAFKEAVTKSVVTKDPVARDGKESNRKMDKIKNNSVVLDESVDYDLAEQCIKDFEVTKFASIPRTNNVDFEGPKLVQWIAGLDTAKYDKIRIAFGLYTAEFLAKYKKDPKLKGRLTVFLVPYKGTEPSAKSSGTTDDKTNPYNIGEIHP